MIKGYDISHWQGDVDFGKGYERGLRFVFIKASQGTYKDKKFESNILLAKKAGMLTGAYHYLDWSVPMDKQAMFFASIVEAAKPELPPVVDYEERKGIPSRAANRLRDFVVAVENLCKTPCIIYTSPSFWLEYGEVSSFWESRFLWIAHYTIKANPTVPRPWKTWTFWQYTDRGDGKYFGAQSKQVDLDLFNGSMDTLLLLTSSGEIEADESGCVVFSAMTGIYSEPSKMAAGMGIRSIGERAKILDIAVETPMRVWIKDEKGWSAITYDGEAYIYAK